MIVDMHAHWWTSDYPARGFYDAFIKYGVTVSGRPEERVRQRVERLIDPEGEQLIASLDKAGIDKCVISMIDFGLTRGIGEGKLSLEAQHALHNGLAGKYPGRLILFMGIDPRRPNAVELLERCVKEWGMKGAKFHPGSGFFPSDRELYPFYAKAQEFGIPLLFHTGPEMYPLYSKYSLPLHLDQVAVDFPELPVIAAHCGDCYWEEAARLAAGKPNMYLDVAGWQQRAKRRPVEEFYGPLRTVLNIVRAHKVLWGTDWPALDNYMSQAEWMGYFQDPPDAAKEAGIEFSQREINAILGGNAARLLGLDR